MLNGIVYIICIEREMVLSQAKDYKMETFIKLNDTAIKIISRNINKKESSWGASSSQHHLITVKANSSAISFDYWASTAQPYIRTAHDLLEALRCFLSDAMGGDMSYEKFCSEFGDDTYEMYTACRKSLKKCEILNIDCYDMYNNLNEKYDM